ncbi:MAG TPA: hypothetical protein VHM26_07865 [Chitinophagaceae bacterium]|nr:hypothetical protein [Chitinophagaceae bacterium]
MVRKYQWYDPVRIKRIRIVLSILIWISWIMILFLQQEAIVRAFNFLFR